ncbi:hypothetical protein [Flavivirga spongiicola]|uniref:Bacteriocin-like protein n=1 Tax=Flavivirga spongiicola TaxID=421621 RepID=A0ABU7XWA8_9FLAO|nr:hypothetical protein [Flavivirga sp. MEBiC05379]MDO5979788.1 hypothetical protein [Flavivirga sp. MEBiC05379]
MKKLSLKNLKLEEGSMLKTNQLKTIFGGYVGYSTPGEVRICETDAHCDQGEYCHEPINVEPGQDNKFCWAY